MAKADYDVPGVAGALARQHAGSLIADLTATQAETVATLVARAVEQGWSKETLKRRLKPVIGLDPRRALAVDNYRQGLEAAGRSPGQVTRMVDAYARRLLNQRLDTIARTEVATITAMAQREVWALQQQTGSLSRYAVRVTRCTKDGKQCPQCRSENGRRRSLQDVNSGPPFHPGCRCSEVVLDEGILKTDPSMVYVPGPLQHFSVSERVHPKDCDCPECKEKRRKRVRKDEHDETVCIMAIPAKTDPVHDIGPEDKHATLLYFGNMSEHKDPDRMKGSKGLLLSVVRVAASAMTPFTATVERVKPLGDDDPPAQVWLLDSPELQRLFKDIPDIDSEIKSLYDDAKATRYPSYTPHVTIGYGPRDDETEAAEDNQVTMSDLAKAKEVQQITFDRLSLWWGNEHIDVPLGVQKDEPRDGDNDGFIYDGKPNMRPATPKLATFVPPGRRSGKDPFYVSAKDDPSKYGEQYHGLKQKSGAPVRGTPIDPADPRIPERLFHITPVKSDVARSGRLMAGGSGGLGGDNRDLVVSLTTDRNIADNIENSMILMVWMARDWEAKNSIRFQDHETGEFSPRIWTSHLIGTLRDNLANTLAMGDTMDEQAANKEWQDWRARTIKGLVDGTLDFQNMMNSFFWLRQGMGEKAAKEEREKPYPKHGYVSRRMDEDEHKKFVSRNADRIEKLNRNPLFFDAKPEVWAAYDLNEIGVVPVNKKDLLRRAGKQRPDGRPLMTGFDLGKQGLEEVRVYGDIPLDIRWSTENAMGALWQEDKSAPEVKIDNNKQINARVREKAKRDPILAQHYEDIGKEHLGRVQGLQAMASDPIVQSILPVVYTQDSFQAKEAHDAFKQKAEEYDVYGFATLERVVRAMPYDGQKTFWETAKRMARTRNQTVKAERKLVSLEKQREDGEIDTPEVQLRKDLAHSLAPMDPNIAREIVEHEGTVEEAAAHGAMLMKTRAAIDGWASTSLDHDTHALAIQRAAYERFKDKGYDAKWEDVLDYLGGQDTVYEWDEENQVSNEVSARKHWEKRIDARYQAEKEYYDAIVDSMYEATQKWLKDNGIEKVFLYRGMTIPRAWIPDDARFGDEVEVGQNPLASWSWDRGVAQGFAGMRGGRNDAAVVFEAEFDAADIFSTAVNGLGCHSEKEFVVLGKANMTLRITQPYYQESDEWVWPHLNEPYSPGEAGDPDDPDDFGTLPSGSVQFTPPGWNPGDTPEEGEMFKGVGTNVMYEYVDGKWQIPAVDLPPVPDIEADAAQADVEEIMGLLEPTGTTGEPKYEGGPGWLPPGLGIETAKKKSIGSIYYDPMGKGWKKNPDGSWSPAKAKAAKKPTAKKTAAKKVSAKKAAAKKIGAIKAAASQPPDFTHLTHTDPADFVIEDY